MQITFYGVRGSIASPGPLTVKYGGNTSCVHLRMNSGENLIFDAGTGIRKLGTEMVQHAEPLLLLISHGHWDHIQGYPFFGPIYQPDREIVVFKRLEGNAIALGSILDQMDGSNFPVHSENLLSRISSIDSLDAYLSHRTYQAQLKQLNHPGGGQAFRIEEDDVSIAYITDNELQPPEKPHTSCDEWVDYCKGVDLLIHDAQYTENDMPAKHGWGHSLISQVRQLAVDAKVKNIVMYHHDPERTDSELDEIAIESARYFKAHKSKIGSYVAAEGVTFDLAATSDPRVSTINLIDS